RPIVHIFGGDVAYVRAELPVAQRRELEAWETFATLLGLTRQFNRDAAALAASDDGTRRNAAAIGYLFADPVTDVVDAEAERHAAEIAPRWCRLYGIADSLAQDCQKQFRRDWLLLFLFGFVAFCCFALFSHLSLYSDLLLGLYTVSFLVIFGLILRARI